MATSIQPGQTVRLDASQMSSLKLSSFSPEQDGCGTSSLAEYKDYIFTWFTTSDAIQPDNWWEDRVSTFKRTNFVYHLTMHDKSFLPPLDTPTILTGNQLIGLVIDNGLSKRPDLQDYRFETTYLGITDDCQTKCSVIMRRVGHGLRCGRKPSPTS